VQLPRATRHIITDTLGLLVGAVVHAANVQDRDGAPALLASIRRAFPWLRYVLADSAYAGAKLQAALARLGDWTRQIVKRSEAAFYQMWQISAETTSPPYGCDHCRRRLGKCAVVAQQRRRRATVSDPMLVDQGFLRDFLLSRPSQLSVHRPKRCAIFWREPRPLATLRHASRGLGAYAACAHGRDDVDRWHSPTGSANRAAGPAIPVQ
jgi:transposase